MAGDELIDDVFEDEISAKTRTLPNKSYKSSAIVDDYAAYTPSPTGYRDYKPPAEVLENNYKSTFRNKYNDSSRNLLRKPVEKHDGIEHKVSISIFYILNTNPIFFTKESYGYIKLAEEIGHKTQSDWLSDDAE